MYNQLISYKAVCRKTPGRFGQTPLASVSVRDRVRPLQLPPDPEMQVSEEPEELPAGPPGAHGTGGREAAATRRGRMREEEMARHRPGAGHLPKIQKAFFLTHEVKDFWHRSKKKGTFIVGQISIRIKYKIQKEALMQGSMAIQD